MALNNSWPKFNWPLGISTMTWKDKLKISKFLFTEPQWTAGKWVEYYENLWKESTKAPYVVMTSSGSSANQLIALRRKWELKHSNENHGNKVLFPVVNWISSVSPFVHAGFDPVFVDVGHNLCATVSDIEDKLISDPQIKTVFYTTLLGFACNLAHLQRVCLKHGVKLLLDNCESSFSYFDAGGSTSTYFKSFNNFVTCSTSIYISHFTSGGNEGGLIFCQNEEEYEWYKMARNHGMTRNMPKKYHNLDANEMFDFYLMGTNTRSSNLLAYMASLDFERSSKFSCEQRKNIEIAFSYALDHNKYDMPHYYNEQSSKYSPLAIPIIKNKKCKDESLIAKVQFFLKVCDVAYRPIVGGNLLRHTAFKEYGNARYFPNAEWIHNQGLYIGLHQGVTIKMAENLADRLSAL